jgi:ABC-type Na+ efflux pump permease subunit
MHSLSLHLKDCLIILVFLNDYLFSSFKSLKLLQQLPSEMAFSFIPPCQSFASLQRGSKYELIYWSVLPCANFFIFYIYYLHMWSSCVMTFLVKRKISETCTAKIIFEEILHGQTFSNMYVITPLHFSFQQFITT